MLHEGLLGDPQPRPEMDDKGIVLKNHQRYPDWERNFKLFGHSQMQRRNTEELKSIILEDLQLHLKSFGILREQPNTFENAQEILKWRGNLNPKMEHYYKKTKEHQSNEVT